MFLLPGSSEEAVLALINQENTLPVDLQPNDLYYGRIKKLSNGSILLPTVTMYDNEYYDGYANFEYKRINLTEVFGGVRPQISELGQTSLHRLLPIINKKLNLNLQPADVIDQAVDWLGGNEQANLPFTATAQSLGYEGGFVIQFTRIRPALDYAIGDKNLLALRHPEAPPAGKTSLAMRTWGIDFSDYVSILTMYSGYWRYLNAIKAMMDDHGFANFPSPLRYEVRGYATKDVPGANKSFSHVYIQKNAYGPDYAGDAYIHFNRS